MGCQPVCCGRSRSIPIQREEIVVATTQTIAVRGVNLHVTEEGEGPAVILLHGFPDSARVWRHQIPALSTAGFRVVAPDLRGFGRSDKPEGVGDYALKHHIGDITGLLDALGIDDAAVVGHDWGASIGWSLAAFVPQRVRRLAALSVGHPSAPGALTIEQREASWYVLFFKFPGLAERAFSRDDWRLFREWLRGDGDIERYIEELSRPDALSAALAIYRANIPPDVWAGEPSAFPAVSCPTLGIWSDGDHYCLEPQMVGSADKVNAPWRYERIEGASHWIPLEAPTRLNELLIDFLHG